VKADKAFINQKAASDKFYICSCYKKCMYDTDTTIEYRQKFSPPTCQLLHIHNGIVQKVQPIRN